jgi:hypothetical protein
MASNREAILSDIFLILVLFCAIFVIINDVNTSRNSPMTGRAIAELSDNTGKVVGWKVVDDPSFETRIIDIERTSSALKVRFSHDSAQPQPVWVEGSVTSIFSVVENATQNEAVTLTVGFTSELNLKFLSLARKQLLLEHQSSAHRHLTQHSRG